MRHPGDQYPLFSWTQLPILHPRLTSSPLPAEGDRCITVLINSDILCIWSVELDVSKWTAAGKQSQGRMVVVALFFPQNMDDWAASSSEAGGSCEGEYRHERKHVGNKTFTQLWLDSCLLNLQFVLCLSLQTSVMWHDIIYSARLQQLSLISHSPDPLNVTGRLQPISADIGQEVGHHGMVLGPLSHHATPLFFHSRFSVQSLHLNVYLKASPLIHVCLYNTKTSVSLLPCKVTGKQSSEAFQMPLAANIVFRQCETLHRKKLCCAAKVNQSSKVVSVRADIQWADTHFKAP